MTKSLTTCSMKRVVLLSDGRANMGFVKPEVIARACAAESARGISTSTYGLGRNFDEDLMVEMGRSGGGNHYYGDTAEDLMDPFQQEFDLLRSLCLRELPLTLTLTAGANASAIVINDLPRVEQGWRLPDLAWGAQAWALIRIRLPASAVLDAGQLQPLLQVKIQAKSLDGESLALERTSLALPVLRSENFAALQEDELVRRRRIELEAANYLTRMRHASRSGDWATVDSLLRQAMQELSSNAWVVAVLEEMTEIAGRRERARMMKEAKYSSSRFGSRLAAKTERDGFTEDLSEDFSASYLRRKSQQGKGLP